ncbi:MAG TPA: phosphatase PAP2 family protein [Solirubrobacterales bacterium]|nr:phosphatase PAP2 family protein [Solirubrobacterales bacterium]
MARRISTPLFAAAGCLGALIVVAFFAYKVGPTVHLDASLLNHLSAPREGLRFGLATVAAHLADPVPLLLMTIAVAALGWHWDRRREVVAAVAVVIGANLTTQVLKHLFEHHRYQDFLGPEQPWANAFPSGHTTAAVAVSIALLLVVPPRLLPRATLIAVAFSAAVGLSVCVIEWHYPSDVVGGTLVAAAWGLAALAWLRYRGDRERAPEAQTASSRFAISTK